MCLDERYKINNLISGQLVLYGLFANQYECLTSQNKTSIEIVKWVVP